jgi:rare lipoprotein A
MTAAHPNLPFGTMLRVTNTQNRKQVSVRVNDRGPFVNTRIIDVSRAAAEALDMISTGTAPVIVELDDAAAPQAPSAVAAGPTESDPWIAPIPAQPPAYPAQPAYPTQQPAYPAQQPAYPAQQPAYPAQPPVFSQPQAPVQPPASFGYAPAVVKPGIPPTGTNKRYRVQIGAYSITRNAVEAFDRVKSVGLEPSYEKYNDYYRVVISGVRAEDIPNLAGRLGSVGFREILLREE